MTIFIDSHLNNAIIDAIFMSTAVIFIETARIIYNAILALLRRPICPTKVIDQ